MTRAEFLDFCRAFHFQLRNAGLESATAAERAAAAEAIAAQADAGAIWAFMDALDCFPCRSAAEFLDLSDRCLRALAEN